MNEQEFRKLLDIVRKGMWEGAKKSAQDQKWDRILDGCITNPEDREGFKLFMIGLVNGIDIGDECSIKSK